MSLVFKGQNWQIFFHVYCRERERGGVGKKQHILKDKILQVLMDLYDMQLQTFVFLSYRQHCSNNDSAQPNTCTITHIYIYMTVLKGGQVGSCPEHHHISGAETLLD